MSVRAVRYRGAGGTEVIELGQTELGPLGPHDVEVAVAAVGLNRADVLQRRGLYPPPRGASDVPGLEYAGTVVAVGAQVCRRAPGDRVMGIVAGGAMAERLLAHEDETLRVPDGMDWAAAAAIPEVFVTAWDALVLQGDVRPGQAVLVHAAASGVGTAAVQLLRRAGARPIGTGRDAQKLARVEGLEAAIVVATPPLFSGAVLASTGGDGAAVILDGVGAAYLSENVRALRHRGTLVVIGLLAGAKGELPLGELLQKRGTVRGSVLRSRPLEEKIALARRFESEVLPGFGDGALRPVIDRVLSMRDVAEAHARMESNANVGKIVLTW